MVSFCLDGINFSELNNVLDYIYYGEVNIYQEDLDRFLLVAQKLQLQGLLTKEEQEQENKKELIDEPTILKAGIVESVNMPLTRQTQEGKTKGWRVRIWSLEVGCKGFPAVSLSTFFKDIGYSGGKRKRIIENIGKVAEQASHTIWKSSFYKNWGNY